MTKSMANTVSAIIPVYNGKDVICSAIDSIISQTRPADEIIIIDDGSTDSTEAVVARYGDAVRYIRQDNAGPAAARNHGIRCANSDLVAFLDSDDVWLPDKLQKQVSALLHDDTIGLVASGYVFCSKDMQNKRPHVVEKLDKRLISCSDLLGENYIGTSTVVVRRECFHKVGFFDESMHFGEDWNMWLRIARHYHVAYVALPLCNYREHESSISSSRKRQNLDDLRDVIQENSKIAKGLREKISVRKAMGRYFFACAQQARFDEDIRGEAVAALFSILNWPFTDRMNFGSLLRCLTGNRIYSRIRKKNS